MSTTSSRVGAPATAGAVLMTLATAQFLMTLDSSVMNVSMATVANDLGTTITGIQTAITLYTLVMATLMITGGKIGTIIGRRRAFTIGCVIYGTGSFVTGIAPNLTVLLIGWSLLEGIGAALIMPAVVALVAGNFAAPERPRAYGLIAAAGAIAVAVGPLIGGAAATYASWRWVFFGEVIIVVVLMVLARRIADSPPVERARLDVVGTLLSIAGLGAVVFGVLRSSEWGWIAPKAGSADLLGISLTFWFVVVGLVVMWLFFGWETRRIERGEEPLMRPQMLANRQLRGGLTMFFFQYLIQAGTFFVVPLFLSVVLELPTVETGLRIMPLSIALLLAAAGIPKVWPGASPRRVVRIGLLMLVTGLLVLLAGIDLDASASVVALPMLLLGAGMGALASQLGAVTVSSVPTEESGEVGGLQNTASNLGASLGTALAGSVLITVLTATLIAGIGADPRIPEDVSAQASVQLASGVPFLSDSALEQAMTEAGANPQTTEAVIEDNREARIRGLDVALAILALIALLSLSFTRAVPDAPAGGTADRGDRRREARGAGH